MSRYRGPRLRKCRRVDAELPGLTRKSYERRPYPPGQHGQKRRRRPSEFAHQLNEKQKLLFNYGLRERQLARLVEEAKRSRKVTGERLLELLESRLDNVVFRAGFAPTIPAARQLVNHRHITVDGDWVDIASYRVSPGQIIAPRDRRKILALVRENLASPSLPAPEWLTVDTQKPSATVVGEPRASSSPLDVDVQLVVEFYSR
ncbi:30S ribosomal protein S4 [Pseudenhygromyxa sp. WMMC2535]|uniref:30S ribosomal protein S4 n=1 Tax=Pseudenhygromyxa sp. WMMC2535 TaxID=2712867 RepID=UPI0015523B12|nr:30S ribosomal protein S4 [Pseudenhygromyxa sp. WMMC2535]NVB41576.1 30S ribosomal protein S4 [Pseudenhygromyxa sp. WMMC2535]